MWDHVGRVITLVGTTQHGRNRIREHGDMWEVIGLPSRVIEMKPRPSNPCLRSLFAGSERWFDPNHFTIKQG